MTMDTSLFSPKKQTPGEICQKFRQITPDAQKNQDSTVIVMRCCPFLKGHVQCPFFSCPMSTFAGVNVHFLRVNVHFVQVRLLLWIAFLARYIASCNHIIAVAFEVLLVGFFHLLNA